MKGTLVLAAVLLGCCVAVLAASGASFWLDVPFVMQEKDGCGSASAAMLIRYWAQQYPSQIKDQRSVQEIHAAIFSKSARGIYASALEQYLQQQGFQTFAFRGEWRDLNHHIELGRPLIVGLKPGAGNAMPHYVVVTGIDSAAGIVMVNDPARRKLLKIARAAFEKDWNACGAWTLLAVPQHGH